MWTDGIALMGKDLYKVVSFKRDIDNEFNITDLGEIQYILGLKVHHDCPKQLIYLSQ